MFLSLGVHVKLGFITDCSKLNLNSPQSFQHRPPQSTKFIWNSLSSFRDKLIDRGTGFHIMSSLYQFCAKNWVIKLMDSAIAAWDFPFINIMPYHCIRVGWAIEDQWGICMRDNEYKLVYVKWQSRKRAGWYNKWVPSFSAASLFEVFFSLQMEIDKLHFLMRKNAWRFGNP
jgi:hypothetical protein